MKNLNRKKIWIAAAVMFAVVLIGLYLPFHSDHEKTLTGYVYQCNEEGKIISMIPVDEVTVKVDVDRQQFLLKDTTTLKGSVEFSNYIKTANEGGPLPVEDVSFAVESQYVRCLGDTTTIVSEVEYRAIEKEERSGSYRSCSDIFYEDEDAYYTTIVFRNPDMIPIYREMFYSKDFDKLMWTDYHNQYVYICSEEAVSSDQMLGYFPEAKVQ